MDSPRTSEIEIYRRTGVAVTVAIIPTARLEPGCRHPYSLDLPSAHVQFPPRPHELATQAGADIAQARPHRHPDPPGLGSHKRTLMQMHRPTAFVYGCRRASARSRHGDHGRLRVESEGKRKAPILLAILQLDKVCTRFDTQPPSTMWVPTELFVPPRHSHIPSTWLVLDAMGESPEKLIGGKAHVWRIVDDFEIPGGSTRCAASSFSELQMEREVEQCAKALESGGFERKSAAEPIKGVLGGPEYKGGYTCTSDTGSSE